MRESYEEMVWDHPRGWRFLMLQEGSVSGKEGGHLCQMLPTGQVGEDWESGPERIFARCAEDPREGSPGDAGERGKRCWHCVLEQVPGGIQGTGGRTGLGWEHTGSSAEDHRRGGRAGA